MGVGRFLAVDWGTTNRRIYLVEEGAVTDEARDGKGVRAMTPDAYPAEITAMRERFGDLPVLAAGMVGSNIGWRPAPYVPAPVGAEALAAAVIRIDTRVAIVPGVSQASGTQADVMRGEEVQVLGAIAGGLAPPDALFVQPGTHCKWVTAAGARITRFATAMTGELFALLQAHSILAPQLAGTADAGPAFLEGVAEGRRRDLAASLFGVRAAALLGRRDDADAAAYASGLLIGAEVSARLEEDRRAEIHLLAGPGLGTLYAAAIEAHGRAVRRVDDRAAFIAGITAIGALL